MASPALIEFASFLEPIPGDEPAGVSAPLVARQKLDIARRDEEPHPDDPTQAPVPKKPEWPQIINTTSELLKEKSKDLNLAGRLTEALARQHGFPGLRDGLHLMADLIEQCWDNDPTLEKPRLHPAPDEGESMEVRAGPFYWLSDADRGARFPTNVRGLPLLTLEGAVLSYRDKKRAEENKGELALSDIERAAPLNDDINDDLQQAQAELARIDAFLNDKLGQDAPDLQGLRQALDDCRGLLDTILRKQPVSTGELAMANGTDSGGGATYSGGDLGKAPGTRNECYDQLTRIANVLERLEPHSPIPDLIRRAVELGRMPFRQLISELIRDGSQLAELRREFGLKENTEGQ